MKASTIFKNPQLAGKILFGGMGLGGASLPQILIAVIIFVIIVVIISYIIKKVRTDSFSGTFFGVGPSAGNKGGTYGWWKPLTQTQQRSPQSDLELQLLREARRKDAQKEGLANLYLEEFQMDPEKAVGFAKPYPGREAMSDVVAELNKRGVSAAMRDIYKVPDASKEGVTALALKNLRSALPPMENMNNITPFVSGQNVANLVANPMERFTVDTRTQLYPRSTTLQDINPNIKDYGGVFGFQDPTQVDFGERVKEKFAVTPYFKKKTIGGTQLVPYLTETLRFLSIYKPSETDLGQVIDIVDQLTPEARELLNTLINKYTKVQIESRQRIELLEKKKELAKTESSVSFTSVDQSELNSLKSFVKKHGDDIDKINSLLGRAKMRLSEKQYLTPSHVPMNACHTQLKRYSTSGALVSARKYAPANACNYSDYMQSLKVAQLGEVDKQNLTKISAITQLE